MRTGKTAGLMAQPPPGTLLAGYRTQPIVGHAFNYWGWNRRMIRQAAIRDVPGVYTSIAPEVSLFQTVNIPAKVQVDINPEYSTAYRRNLGYAGYLERTPYVQGQKGQSTMQPRWQFPFTIQPPRYSTLPQIFGVGGL